MRDGVELLDVREAAALVRRTPETVRRWVWSGRLRARKEGSRLLLERRVLEAMAPRTTAADLTLADWADRAAEFQARTRHGPHRRESSADLVLDDRRTR